MEVIKGQHGLVSQLEQTVAWSCCDRSPLRPSNRRWCTTQRWWIVVARRGRASWSWKQHFCISSPCCMRFLMFLASRFFYNASRNISNTSKSSKNLRCWNHINECCGSLAFILIPEEIWWISCTHASIYHVCTTSKLLARGVKAIGRLEKPS